METVVVNNRFENGKRVCTQEVRYEKSDDLFSLANFQRQYENVCSQIKNATEGTNVEYLRKNKARLEECIANQELLLKGYSEEGVTTDETNQTASEGT